MDQREALSRSRRSLPSWSILGGLLVLSVAVRLVGLAADLPFMHHPDEPVNLRIIDGMIRRGDPNPQFFKYPSLFLYLQAALHLDGPLLGWIPGLSEQAPITQVMGVSYAPTAGSVLLHRWVSVILGTLVVLVGWGTARRVTTGLLPATVTGLLLALSPTLVTYSRLITPDVPAALLVAVAIYAAVRVQQSGSWWAYTAAGLAVGLAASTKYNAVLAAIPVIVAGLLARRAALGLPLAATMAVVGFLATTPYAVLDHTEFLKGLQFERNHYASGHSGMEGSPVAYYTWHLASWEGLLVVLAIAGLVAVRQRWRLALVLISFPLAYGTLISLQAVRNDRTIMLILPPLAVLAALATQPLARWARTYQAAALAAFATVLTAVAAVLSLGAVSTLPWSGPSTWIAHAQLPWSGPSTWTQAQRWFQA
ncbi:MAG: glycosyltransferase family 39 protein, partial [Actinomycetota bacterium]|nr:glycosyltransferase family 39 protein [Actinomycetota bacterium]